MCQSVLTFLAGLCQRDVLLYEPLQHQVSCWMLCHVKLQRAQRAQRIKHKVTIKASFREYPSKKKILSYSYLLFKCWHFCALFLTAVTHLAFNPSWYQLLIGQLSHSRHGGPQVPTGRRQDVADGDAGRLVHRHGSCVVTQVFQQRWGDNFQQLLPPSCCVLFTEQSRNMWPSLHLRLLYVSITIYFYFLGLNKTVHIAVTCVRFRLPSPTPWWSPAPGELGLWGSAGTPGPFYRTCYLRPHPEILGSPGKVGHKWVFNGDTS